MAEPGKILVVDDEPAIRQLLLESLSEEGHHVELAGTGRQAQQVLAARGFDVLILDLSLPDMRGEDVLSSLDGNGMSRPQVIVITGYATTESAIRVLQHEAYDYIRKPFPLDTLLTSVQRAMEKRRLATENVGLIEQLRAHERKLSVAVKRATTELAAQNRRLDDERHRTLAILHSLSEAVVTCGLDARVSFLNAEAERILSVSSAQAVGKPWRVLVGIPAADCPVRATLASRTGLRDVQVGIKAAGGERTAVRVSTSLFLNGSGQPAGVAIVFRDIGPEERLERMKSDFVTAASHELRTPLTSIRGYVELLLSGAAGELRGTQRECIEAVERNSAKLSRLTATILDLSRIEGGVFQVLLEPTDIVAVAKAAGSQAARTAAEHRVAVAARSKLKTLIIESDPRRLHQVIEELLSNAIRHTPSGGHVTIEVSNNDDNGGVISVSDDGAGVPRDHLERIFDKFHKVDGAAVRDDDGVGLGLAIAKAIVVRLGGSIAVESSLGHGTTFALSLPARPP